MILSNIILVSFLGLIVKWHNDYIKSERQKDQKRYEANVQGRRSNGQFKNKIKLIENGTFVGYI